MRGSQALTSGDLRHQAGRETSGQKVLGHQIQLYSWEEAREFRMTWALELDEEVEVGSKELCRIQARGQRQLRKPREMDQVEVQKAGGKEGGNKTWGPRDPQEPKGAGAKLGRWREPGGGEAG